MIVLFHIIAIFSTLVFAAHFLRMGNTGATVAVLLFIPMMMIRHQWVKTILQIALSLVALSWIKTTMEMVHIRMSLGEPWIRMSIIMGGVIAMCAAAALLLNRRTIRMLYCKEKATSGWSATAFMLTFVLLAVVQLKVSSPMLLPERFLFGGGWISVVALSMYAALLVQKMSDPKDARPWRKRIWLLFAAAFFGQFIVGVLGVEQFLMSGNLHVPVPAVIVAGPVFRGEGFFMPILMGITLLLVGPAWCSHLCYFGGFDLLAATSKKRPQTHKKWFAGMRMALLFFTILVALLLRAAGVSGLAAAMIAVGFGAVSIGTMGMVSRRMGTMFHCAAVCPVGLVAVFVGKASPFRMKFTDTCDGCGACGLTCPMGALEKHHISRRKVGLNCTLCGDCLSTCRSEGLAYQFGPWRSPRIRMIFLVIVISLHAVFLGVARV